MPYKDKEKAKENARQYRANHPEQKEKQKEYRIKYDAEHKEEKKVKAAVRYQKNKVKVKAQRKEYESNNKEKVSRARRNRKLIKLYNITADEYDILFESQKGCCAVCGIHQNKIIKTLAVDHDHETGKVRGLLCNLCNTGIGNMRDNPVLLRQAAEYLESYLGGSDE